jgi:hypothetical protein
MQSSRGPALPLTAWRRPFGRGFDSGSWTKRVQRLESPGAQEMAVPEVVVQLEAEIEGHRLLVAGPVADHVLQEVAA